MSVLRTAICFGSAFALLAAKVVIDQTGAARTRKPPSITLESAEDLSKSLQKFSFGFDSALAGLLWVKLLQDASHLKMESGEVSWEFAQLNAITALDPAFIRAYDFGATFLSVFRQDKLGAKRLLERWTLREPTNWRAHYTYGYHLFAEMNLYEDAAKEIFRAAELEHAPYWLSALGVRLLSETGANLTALEMAVKLYSSVTDQVGAQRIIQRIRALRFNLERSQWSHSLDEFRKTHHREPSDLTELAALRAESQRELASFGKDLDIHEDLMPLFRERFAFFYDPKRREVRAELSASDRYLETSGILRRAK